MECTKSQIQCAFRNSFQSEIQIPTHVTSSPFFQNYPKHGASVEPNFHKGDRVDVPHLHTPIPTKPELSLN
jgi:hypothetical protein